MFGRPTHPARPRVAPLRSTLRRGRAGRVFGRPAHPARPRVAPLRSTLRRGRAGRVFGRPAHPAHPRVAPLRSTLRRGRAGRVFGRPAHLKGWNRRAEQQSRPPQLRPTEHPPRSLVEEQRSAPCVGRVHGRMRAAACMPALPAYRRCLHTGAACIPALPALHTGAACIPGWPHAGSPPGGPHSAERGGTRGRRGPGSFSAGAEAGGSVVPPADSNLLGAEAEELPGPLRPRWNRAQRSGSAV